MEIWISVSVSVLLIPIIILIIGFWFSKKPPENINHLLGYRTARSMKNEQTWAFAQKYTGKVFKFSVIIILVLSIILMLLVLGKDEKVVANCGTVICVLQVVMILVSIIPVECALKKNFNDDGTKK